jgi:putative hydrolase of the HAD superfamily
MTDCMIRAVVFDVDGMVVHKNEMFSVRFGKKHGIPMERMLEFFKGEFQKCIIGEADLKEELKPYLDKWGVKESVDEVMKFWFEGEREVDERGIVKAKELRDKGVFTVLATNNEKYRVKFLLDEVKLGQYFDAVVSSAEAGSKKPQINFFEYIMKKVPTADPSEVMFWDNDEKNVEGAKAAGMQAHLYVGFDNFELELKEQGL